MLAPIALYPDELLTQVLIASTYPDDVADARSYLDRYPSLSGALLGYQVSAMPWDDSVKSLTQFPSLLAMLDDQPDWTDALGYAFCQSADRCDADDPASAPSRRTRGLSEIEQPADR